MATPSCSLSGGRMWNRVSLYGRKKWGSPRSESFSASCRAGSGRWPSWRARLALNQAGSLFASRSRRNSRASGGHTGRQRTLVSMRVWVAGEEDVGVVAGLMAAFRDWMGYDEPADKVIRRVVEQLVPDPDTDYLLGATDGEAAGICQLRYRPCVWTGADDCWLEDLFVRDEARGAGLGRALVEAAFERARARGVRRMDLDVNEKNPDAVAFYERMGFTLEPKAPGRTFYIARALD